jgi:NAD(P)-dependent dehydrogenase (short-subunit alcohol dehydrogenase family)
MNPVAKVLIIACVVIVIAQMIGMVVQLGLFVHRYFCLREHPELNRVHRRTATAAAAGAGAGVESPPPSQPCCWAVITGASSGQGREFALQLADRGFNLVLIGSKRSHAVADIVRKKAVECVVVVKDFGRAYEDHFFDDIQATLRPLDVAVLVNNVGHRTGWKPFHEAPTETIRETIACGTMVQTRMTHMLLPQMTRRLEQVDASNTSTASNTATTATTATTTPAATNTCRSTIIFVTAQCMHPNTGLAAAGLYSNEISVPYLATYEASNAYGFYHACSLIKEYADVERLDMLNITPGAVITENTAHTLQNTPFSVSAKDFVTNVLRFMGGNVSNGTTCAHWGHAMSNALVGLVPWKKDHTLRTVGESIATDYMKRYNGQQDKYRDMDSAAIEGFDVVERI